MLQAECKDIRLNVAEILEHLDKAEQYNINRDNGAEPSFQTAGLLDEITHAQTKLLYSAMCLQTVITQECMEK